MIKARLYIVAIVKNTMAHIGEELYCLSAPVPLWQSWGGEDCLSPTWSVIHITNQHSHQFIICKEHPRFFRLLPGIAQIISEAMLMITYYFPEFRQLKDGMTNSRRKFIQAVSGSLMNTELPTHQNQPPSAPNSAWFSIICFQAIFCSPL